MIRGAPTFRGSRRRHVDTFVHFHTATFAGSIGRRRTTSPWTTRSWQFHQELPLAGGRADAVLAYRLSAWPEDGRPPAEVMDFLKRQHLLAAARAMRI
ncbi:MAG: hypothetical protein ABFC89_06235 [Methanospirillum sp.]